MKFKRGESGCPAGRPRGIQDRRAKLRQALEKDGGKLLAKLVEMGLAGDTESLRFLVGRLIPPAKDVPISVPAAGTLAEQGNAILGQMMTGKITANDAAELLRALGSQAALVDHVELARRIEALETRLHEKDVDP